LIFVFAEVIPEITKKDLQSDIVVATVTGSYNDVDLENIPDVIVHLNDSR
tara:strand:+ start:613 stop:762 length:150 start_codon:yes stop_codon:yes gene_type:complete